MNLQPIFTIRFREIATMYIKEGEVLKVRSGYEHVSVEEMKETRNKLIIEEGRKLYCYFKDEDKFIIEDIIESHNKMGIRIGLNIEYK